jgi:hypothetical protein
VPTFTISGTVTTSWTLLPMPGVTVTAEGLSRASTTTDARGIYRLPNLLAGEYRVTVFKPFYRTFTNQVSVFSDVTHDRVLPVDQQSPPSPSNLSGAWVGHGPYRDEPLWLALVDTGTGFEGTYRDRTYTSYAVSGSRQGTSVLLRIDVGGGFVLTVEGDVPEGRCLWGVIKNEALGGNFPITFSRGAVPQFCAR